MPLLDISNAVTWDAARLHPNHIAMMGDSRMSTLFNDSAQLQFTSVHFFNQANLRMGQRMKVVVNNATAGYRSDQYLTDANVAQVLASDALWVMIYGVVNDIGTGFNYDPWNTYIKPVVEKLINAGRNVILVTDPGQTGVAGSTNARTAFQKYNNLIRQYAVSARANARVVLFDLASIILDLTTTTIAFKSGYSSDGTHYLVNAAVVAGRAFAALMAPLVPPLPIRKVYGGETATLGIQIFSNPGFLTASGGTKGGFGGTAAAGITNGTVDAGVTGTLGTAANADGTNDVTAVISTTGAGRARVFMDISAGHDAPGNVFDYYIQATITAGATNLVAAEFFVEYNQTTNTPNSLDFVDMVGATSGIGTQGLGDITETLDFWMTGTIPAGTRGYHSIHLDHYFSGAGNATINWRHLAVDLRQ
jgi:hypothetical protein